MTQLYSLIYADTLSFICASDCCPVQCSGVQRNLICGAKKFKQKMQRSQRQQVFFGCFSDDSINLSADDEHHKRIMFGGQHNYIIITYPNTERVVSLDLIQALIL